jgi:DNA-binding Xre family transcriptional regulator
MSKTAKKTKSQQSTFEREMQDSRFKAAFEKNYEVFVLEELLAAMAQGNEMSVRSLAKEAGLHPNAIQNLRSGKTTDIKLSSFMKIAHAHGFDLQLVKGKKRIPVNR